MFDDGAILLFRKKHPKLEVTKRIIAGNDVYIRVDFIIC